ncbi:MAG: DNA polymerase III subunit chi [Gammaproteobacteria bacterium]|nr:DNA polymerase III subunit chi [Gammaproteobacteria bacterium]
MSRVDFYILPDQSKNSLQHFACRLTDKAWQQGHRILIQTDSAEDSRMLDDMLWVFSDGSFIPHAVVDASDNKAQPVLISHLPQGVDQGRFQLMINLSSRAAAQDQFERIAEILNQEPARKKTGREHYKIYREKNYALNHHEIKQ